MGHFFCSQVFFQLSRGSIVSFKVIRKKGKMSIIRAITSLLIVSGCQGFSSSGSFSSSHRFGGSSGFGNRNFGSSSYSGGRNSFSRNGGGFHRSVGGGSNSLAQVLSTRPSNADSTVDVAKEPLVPNKLAVAPPQTAKVALSNCHQTSDSFVRYT